MKNLVFTLFLLYNLNVFAQKPCETDTNITDSLGTYKLTKQFIIFERSFAGNSTDILFALSSNNGVLGLETQQLQSSAGFIKANCFDANSRIFLQLNNGKIVTLLFAGNESCGTLIRNDKNENSRILSGSFVFSKENFEDLKTSQVTFMRIRFSGETIDYPFKTEFTAELDKKTYQPENYFIEYLKCVEN
ncbi:hypothetical protein QWY90_08400 [Flavobacterium paronense]|uniref:Lipocalin-like domain-containing protein n=1 Tax=Flavobacterium paronense TaxID=1392775 RepID=A0ABV5GA51_9FLAO|nr:hypothetical protein [Flavobacterium paronense]MDN3677335.1 hypothetical protein [Flavobacterium paronense]